MDISIDEKTSQHIEEKQAIAKAAQTLIKPDDAIILASGSTVTAFAEKLEPNGMMKAASQTVVLADSSKFGRRGFGKIGNIEDIDIIITDKGMPESLREKIEDAGVQIIIADE